MSEFDAIPRQRSYLTSAIFIFLTALVGFVLVGPAIGFVLAMPFIDGSLVEFANTKIQQPLSYPEIKIPYLIIQGSATLFGLGMGPALYWFAIEKKKVSDLMGDKPVSAAGIILVSIVVILFMAPNSVVIDWNEHVSLPAFLKDFEDAFRNLEDKAGELTRFFTLIGSPGEFIFILLIVAVLPGIAEELVFRGLLQPQLQRSTGNAHAGIWISAFLFSMLHMQFFGFIPRVFLGALFGYLFYWSGNLIIPMFAHFVNNAYSVIVLYLQQLGKVDAAVGDEPAPWPVVIIGTILTFGLLFYLKKFFERNPSRA